MQRTDRPRIDRPRIDRPQVARSRILALAAILLSACGVGGGSPSVVITWMVESEQNTAGYNVLRAESAGGPFTQINPTLIPASGDPVVTHSYSYTDHAVVCGQTYWYKLQEIETNGVRTVIEDKVTQVTACQR
jgi:hypothetical protein